jgi:glycosyltransferase involved in cell wall biosynthesis
MTEITAVLNVHGEGILAHASLLSMLAAKRVAEADGISVEVVVAADCPDAKTRDYLPTARRLGARILELDADDLGLARNAAVAASSGRFVAFLDGDDLWSGRWLAAAHAAAMRDGAGVVWHPEASLFFGPTDAPYWRVHPAMDDAAGDWVSLGLRNHWTSLCFAPREILESVPYRPTNLKAGLGFEDWSWNAETIARGFVHRPVPGTAHLVRMRAASLVLRTRAASALMTPSTLFRRRLGWATARRR